jgi:mono/diheme cytochrome c family protein
MRKKKYLSVLDAHKKLLSSKWKCGGVMKKAAILVLFIFAVAGWVIVSDAIFPGHHDSFAQSSDGASLYAVNCGPCHAKGGNIINKALPVTGSAKIKSLSVFTAYNRNPLKADGTKGVMPAFPKEKISDKDMKLIYDYALTLPGK